MTLTKLKKQYENSCNEYVQRFAKKQGLIFDGWVGSIGDVAVFSSQYPLKFNDIQIDLHTKQPKGLILEWLNGSIEFHLNNPNVQYINYESYIMGGRHGDTEVEK
jgi:hypothetical protein